MLTEIGDDAENNTAWLPRPVTTAILCQWMVRVITGLARPSVRTVWATNS